MEDRKLEEAGKKEVGKKGNWRKLRRMKWGREQLGKRKHNEKEL